MIQKISSDDRFFAHHGWLSSYHLFSFADYYDPKNMNFGALRVFNDDYIDGESGFGDHSHQNMEIVTIMLEGELTHKDNMGNKKTMRAGEVQYMSAGTGVVHSEINEAKEKIHLYQIWIIPKEKGLKPDYDQKDFSEIGEKNSLIPVASDKPQGEAIIIKDDTTIYTAGLEIGKTIVYTAIKGRGVFIYVTEGSLDINGISFTSGDQARVEGEERLTISAVENAKFILIDVAI